MNEFIEIPATKNSLANRKLMCGVGINDAWYMVRREVNGKPQMCPFYKKWVGMLRRCYSKKWHSEHPTYKDCTVCDEWLTFSNFRSWMIGQDWQGKALDKDILVQGNKVYSPAFCIFVTQEINNLLCDSKARRGEFPLGVSLHKAVNKYRARVGDEVLGYFTDVDSAFTAYKVAKYKKIRDVAMIQSEPLRSALLNYKIR